MNIITKFLIFSIFIFLFGSASNAQVLWYGDPDLSVNDNFRRLDPNGNSNPTGNSCVDDPNNKPFVTTPIDNVHGKFWRITKPTSRKRAEFARTTGDRNSFTPQKGGTYYYGWRWRINSTPNINDDVTVFQWKTDQGSDINTNKQHYPFNMEYDGTFLSLHAFGPAEPNFNRPGSITQRRTTLWKQAIPENQWVSFVIKVNLDSAYDNANNRYQGYVEFWFNGEQQTLSNRDFNQYQVVLANSNTRAYHRTYDGIEVYPKWGAYNENACDLEIITDFDEMRVATTFEAALPENSTDDNHEEGLEGTYKIKHQLTGKYWTVENANIITADETSSNNAAQIFEVKSVGTVGHYNISSTVLNWDAIRFHEGNVYPTSTTTPTSATNNTRIFQFISNGSGAYDIHTPQTTTSRYAYDISGDVKYITSANDQTKWILESHTLSVNDNKSINKFKLCPNPVKNMLKIKTNHIKLDKIEVFNLLGKKMIVEQINNEKEIIINVSSLVVGVYFVRLYNAGNVITKKLIKE